ncbi:PLP-dependent aminotransferase family protein [Bacillus sp. REN3]|uniref:aminotransferase-like domain-containing protein n=1 Tax=Bacillus sp. REN3 TaxID=2802440 RepID=UPI001AEE947D|nr:PLP-dependent aminotransferase family protein [Bacillus sp. REN3]
MKGTAFFPEHIKTALKNTPPGEWLPDIPAGCIRLSSGYPAPHLVPVKEFKAAIAGMLDVEEDLPFHYIGSPGIPRLKEQIRERLAVRGMAVGEEELLITSGACQAIDLLARVLVDRDTVVALESPTYMEALEIFKNYTERFISLAVDEHGLDTTLFEKALAERKKTGRALPRFLYTIPSFQNPTGTTMSAKRREHLLSLASKYDFLIIEDDAYGELGFKEKPVPIKALDKEGRVIHIGSFSKVVAPGLRVGWLAGPGDVTKAAAWFKKDLDHPFAQASMAAFLEGTDFGKRLELLTDTYRQKAKEMIVSMKKNLPEEVSWYMPEGGYFVWLKVPGVDTAEMLEKALDLGVSYVPGKYFFLDQAKGSEFLRISFSYVEKEEIIEGVKRLGNVMKTMRK